MKIFTHSDKESEKALIKLASNGDLDAFNQLVLKYQDWAYYCAKAILGDPTFAEDATQESFIKAFLNIGTFRGDVFRAWLFKIVTNTSISLLRSHKRHLTMPLTIVDDDGYEIESPYGLADPSASVEATVERNEFSEILHQMLDELPTKYRIVLTLIDLYELDYLEVAEILNLPLGTVKSRLARGRFKVKKKLQMEFYRHNGLFPNSEDSAVRENPNSVYLEIRGVTG